PTHVFVIDAATPVVRTYAAAMRRRQDRVLVTCDTGRARHAMCLSVMGSCVFSSDLRLTGNSVFSASVPVTSVLSWMLKLPVAPLDRKSVVQGKRVGFRCCGSAKGSEAVQNRR